MTRHIGSLARKLARLPAWSAAVAVAFLLGAIAGPMAASAHPAGGATEARNR